MKTKRKNITARTQERVHRLAYDFEHMAARARADGLDMLANTLQSIASSCGNIARNDDAWGVGRS